MRGLVAAAAVGVPLAVFVTLSLHATREIAVLIGAAVGLAIFAVVATQHDAHDEAADAAWREAASDLPPVSDRVMLERMQVSLPGPEKSRKAVPTARHRGEATKPGGAPGSTGEPR
jgi:hypothetical protein